LGVTDASPGWPSPLRAKVKGRALRGHGLEFSFVEAIVRVHGASATAINRPKGGTQLTVTLPLCEAQKQKELTPLLSRAEQNQATVAE
jgi:hypothetical protein